MKARATKMATMAAHTTDKAAITSFLLLLLALPS